MIMTDTTFVYATERQGKIEPMQQAIIDTAAAKRIMIDKILDVIWRLRK